MICTDGHLALPIVPLHLIVAMDLNRGFGQNGQLPWSLKKEFDNFLSLILHTSSSDKKVALIKGRLTWESTVARERSLPEAINIIISSTLTEPTDCVWRVVKTFREALCAAKTLLDDGIIEKIWILGGVSVYKAALDSGLCKRLYITRIQATYNCDVFFPHFEDKFCKISYEQITDQNVSFLVEVYEPVAAHSIS